MSSLPAKAFRSQHRGQLRQANWADIVVFDPEKVQDPATYNDPHHSAMGIPHVLVDGAPVIKAGDHTGAKSGAAFLQQGRDCNAKEPQMKPSAAQGLR